MTLKSCASENGTSNVHCDLYHSVIYSLDMNTKPLNCIFKLCFCVYTSTVYKCLIDSLGLTNG